MTAKTQQLQVRVTPQEKAALKRQARAAGLDVSTYVLSRALPGETSRFAQLLDALAGADSTGDDGAGTASDDHRYALAELNDFLHDAPPMVFLAATAEADVSALSPYLRNYVAAMVEQAAAARNVSSPTWTAGIAPLEEPHFVTPLKRLRIHLLQSSPVPFKRRNIFIDSGVGARV